MVIVIIWNSCRNIRIVLVVLVDISVVNESFVYTWSQSGTVHSVWVSCHWDLDCHHHHVPFRFPHHRWLRGRGNVELWVGANIFVNEIEYQWTNVWRTWSIFVFFILPETRISVSWSFQHMFYCKVMKVSQCGTFAMFNLCEVLFSKFVLWFYVEWRRLFIISQVWKYIDVT